MVENVNNVNSITTQFVKKLDAEDGNQDGKIVANVWNNYSEDYGWNTVENEIGFKNAVGTAATYAKKNEAILDDMDQECHILPERMTWESVQCLIFAGLEPEMANEIGVKRAYFANEKGAKALVLESSEGFKLQITMDDKYSPENIHFYTPTSKDMINIRGVSNGKLDILRERKPGTNNSVKFSIENSNLHVICADGVRDCISVDPDSNVTIVTRDYADTLETYSSEEGGVTERLKPGTRVLKTQTD